MKNLVSGWWPLCASQQAEWRWTIGKRSIPIFSWRLHTRQILRITVEGNEKDGGNNLQWKQYKENTEDYPRSSVNCPYTKNHRSCKLPSGWFSEHELLDNSQSAAPRKRTNDQSAMMKNIWPWKRPRVSYTVRTLGEDAYNCLMDIIDSYVRGPRRRGQGNFTYIYGYNSACVFITSISVR